MRFTRRSTGEPQLEEFLRWFEVVQTRGHIEEGEVRHYQVVIKAGFTLEGGG